MLVDKTICGLVLYNHANFYRFEETSSYWLGERTSFFLCFSLVNKRLTSGITVYSHTVTNIENLCGPCTAAKAELSDFFHSNSRNVLAISGSCIGYVTSVFGGHVINQEPTKT